MTRRILLSVLAPWLAGMLLAPPVVAAGGDLLTLHSATGDYIGQGVDRTFTDANATFKVISFDGTYLHVGVTSGAEWWYVDIAAPPGQPLAVGSYPNALRAAFRGTAPGLDIYGDGRGCNNVYGSFTVTQAWYGPGNVVYGFDATFEQHCEQPTAPALTGELRIDAAPAALSLSTTVSTSGTFRQSTGVATVGGTVTCTETVPVTVTGTISQTAARGASTGSFTTTVTCSMGTPASWSASATGSGKGFTAGTVQVSATASAVDPSYGTTVSTTATGTATLTKVR